MSTFRPGNIVYWDNEKKFPAVVMYVTVPKWEKNGKRYARLANISSMVHWVEEERLELAKDTRSSKREEQAKFLVEFWGYDLSYVPTLMNHLGWKSS